MEQDIFETKRECKCAGKCGACQTLNLTYGVEQSQFSPYMQALREALRQETLRKMEREGATPQP